ncbi:thiosulfate sulfurtransferase GlpE [Motiliproteus sp. SC1-56]|uniref:thiosulfate sulfurtransferase GlpE n=1 Tax=Motiliproteus sp. SC1-56 TaxID=2799565 RepID=UPI001A8EF05C|nr:thiosulfate sulfurtransferase GlpE [Motiliproteus sp. SC1-56]
MEQFQLIDPDAAKALLDAGAALADIRDEESFARGHIRGAQHLGNHNLQEFIDRNDLDLPLIVCCYHGNSSQPAAQYLFERGFEAVYSLNGGYEIWQTRYPETCDTGTP